MKKPEAQLPVEEDNKSKTNSDEKTTFTDEPAPKKQRLSNKEYKKLRSGQNKVSRISFSVTEDAVTLFCLQARPLPFKAKKEDNLCKAFFDGPDGKECKFPNCKFIHDVEHYLDKKPADIGPLCHVYSTRGFCARGLTCRFAKSHIDENGKNIKSESYNESAASEVNHISAG